VRLTRRATVVALAAVVIVALAWPDGAERVGRGALLVLGAAFVADLVIELQHALPTERTNPFTPPRDRPLPPSLPKGLIDLQRDIRLMSIDGGGRRLPLSTRLQTTARAAAVERLLRHGLELPARDDPQRYESAGFTGDGGRFSGDADGLDGADSRHRSVPEAEAAARALLGDGPYDFVTGREPTVDVDALIAAVEAP
jgi:hypothetical protein